MPKKKNPEADPKLQLFIKYYTDPMSETFNNGLRSMAKAGYSPSYCHSFTIFRTRPEVERLIQEARDRNIKPILEEGFQKVLNLKMKTMDRDLSEFYRTEMVKGEDGSEHQIQVMIPLDELTPEQRQQVIDLEYKGARGVPGYQLLSKEQAMNDILKLHEKYCAPEEKAEDHGIEVTLEGIKDKVTAKVKVIDQKRKQSELANDYMEKPAEITEEL